MPRKKREVTPECLPGLELAWKVVEDQRRFCSGLLQINRKGEIGYKGPRLEEFMREFNMTRMIRSEIERLMRKAQGLR